MVDKLSRSGDHNLSIPRIVAGAKGHPDPGLLAPSGHRIAGSGSEPACRAWADSTMRRCAWPGYDRAHHQTEQKLTPPKTSVNVIL